MATSVTGKVTLQAEFYETKSNDLGISNLAHRLALGSSASGVVNYADGNAADQVDLVYSDSYSVTSGAPITFDLAGSLTSLLDGSAVTFTGIRGFVVTQKTGTGALQIGAGSNPLINWVAAAGDAVKIGLNGFLGIANPTDAYAVTAGTGDVLTLTASAGTITGDILIWGY